MLMPETSGEEREAGSWGRPGWSAAGRGKPRFRGADRGLRWRPRRGSVGRPRWERTKSTVGNRAAGDRLVAMVGVDLAACAAALLLTLPYTPMLFMGEEWGASTPWCFFSSFPG